MVVFVGGASACGANDGGSKDGPEPKAEDKRPAKPTGTLRVALSGQTPSLDPTQVGTLVNVPVLHTMYDGLTSRLPENPDKLSPGLATAWKTNADATTWTITLRKGVKFHDGEPFNSAAAKKTLRFYLRPASALATALGPVSSIQTPDAFTLVVKYKEPFPDLAFNMYRVVMMSPRLLEGPLKEVERRVAKQAVGTGPYVLDSFSPAGGTVVHANPQYWRGGPYIERLKFSSIPEESARLAALRSGDIDLVLGVSPRAAQSLADDSRIELSTQKAWAVTALNVANAKKPLNDSRVRQALAYAVDPKTIVEHVLLGQAEANGSVAAPGIYGYRKPATQYTYDPAKAKALLAEAGVKPPVKLRMAAFQTCPDCPLTGQVLVEQAKAAGFDIKLDVMPDAAVIAELGVPDRKHDLIVEPFGWAGFPLHFAIGTITNQSNYTGKKLLNLVKALQTTPNGPKREQIIADTQEAAQEGLPFIPLYTKQITDASTKALQGHTPPKDGYRPVWNQQYLAGA